MRSGSTDPVRYGSLDPVTAGWSPPPGIPSCPITVRGCYRTRCPQRPQNWWDDGTGAPHLVHAIAPSSGWGGVLACPPRESCAEPPAGLSGAVVGPGDA